MEAGTARDETHRGASGEARPTGSRAGGGGAGRKGTLPVPHTESSLSQDPYFCATRGATNRPVT